MPTAAKLVAGLCLAALGYLVSDQIRLLLPANTDFGAFNYVNAAIGLLCGWLVIGSRAGRGTAAAIGNGFTGTMAMVVWGLFVQACNEMVAESLKRRYDTVVEAIASVFEHMIEFGQTMLVPEVILTLLVGGIATGLVAEFAAGRWR